MASPAKVAGRSGAAPLQVDDLLIVDDHPLMCDALALTLKMSFGLRHARAERSLAAAVESIRGGRRPHAGLLDLRLAGARGGAGGGTPSGLPRPRLLPEAPTTVISAELARGMVGAEIPAGAAGYISKAAGRDVLCASLRRIWAGEVVVPEGIDIDAPPESAAEDRAEIARKFATLTPQQMRILRLICAGKANKEISYELNIAEATVKTHITAIMGKINARRRTQAVRLANAARLFPVD